MTGWTVTHLYYRLRETAEPELAGKELLLAAEAFQGGANSQVLACTTLGLKADLGLLAIGPDPAAHTRLTAALRSGVIGRLLEPAYSFVSVTETSEYFPKIEQTRERLVAEGARDLEGQLQTAAERLERYREDKLHPRLPRRRVLAFYPMSKAREPGANWYRLEFDQRRRLMGGHATVGRRYAGRVLQLITGATGLDDFEWGVTLLADDLEVIKEIVYEMRFDEVTATYGRFGPFFVGLTCEIADLPAALGLIG